MLSRRLSTKRAENSLNEKLKEYKEAQDNTKSQLKDNEPKKITKFNKRLNLMLDKLYNIYPIGKVNRPDLEKKEFIEKNVLKQ